MCVCPACVPVCVPKLIIVQLEKCSCGSEKERERGGRATTIWHLIMQMYVGVVCVCMCAFVCVCVTLDFAKFA